MSFCLLFTLMADGYSDNDVKVANFLITALFANLVCLLSSLNIYLMTKIPY